MTQYLLTVVFADTQTRSTTNPPDSFVPIKKMWPLSVSRGPGSWVGFQPSLPLPPGNVLRGPQRRPREPHSCKESGWWCERSRSLLRLAQTQTLTFHSVSLSLLSYFSFRLFLWFSNWVSIWFFKMLTLPPKEYLSVNGSLCHPRVRNSEAEGEGKRARVSTLVVWEKRGPSTLEAEHVSSSS